MSVGVYIGIIYCANNWGAGCKLFFTFGCLMALRAKNRGVVCQLVFTLVLYILCQQSGG